MITDNRKKYKDEFWNQGRLLMTYKVNKLPIEEQIRLRREEQRMAFINFSIADDGRSRQLVYVFKDEYECEIAVEKHNEKLFNKINKS